MSVSSSESSEKKQAGQHFLRNYSPTSGSQCEVFLRVSHRTFCRRGEYQSWDSRINVNIARGKRQSLSAELGKTAIRLKWGCSPIVMVQYRFSKKTFV